MFPTQNKTNSVPGYRQIQFEYNAENLLDSPGNPKEPPGSPRLPRNPRDPPATPGNPRNPVKPPGNIKNPVQKKFCQEGSSIKVSSRAAQARMAAKNDWTMKIFLTSKDLPFYAAIPAKFMKYGEVR